jgi:hypothetical protein
MPEDSGNAGLSLDRYVGYTSPYHLRRFEVSIAHG